MGPKDRGALFALGIMLLAIVLLAPLVFVEQVQPPSPPADESPRAGQGRTGGWELGDTYAQWIMAVFTVVGAGISFWAVRLVRDTLRETRRTADAAVAAAEESRSANAIALADRRAWIGIDALVQPPVIQVTEEGCSILLQAQLHNYGRVPATNVGCYFEIVWRWLGYEVRSIPLGFLNHGILEFGAATVFPDRDFVSVPQRVTFKRADLKPPSHLPPDTSPAFHLVLAVGYDTVGELGKRYTIHSYFIGTDLLTPDPEVRLNLMDAEHTIPTIAT